MEMINFSANSAFVFIDLHIYCFRAVYRPRSGSSSCNSTTRAIEVHALLDPIK